ncbi:MAG: hypothetical protein CVV63_03795, partial [Tenericutes bacterium HGW-Tenericutes-8]
DQISLIHSGLFRSFPFVASSYQLLNLALNIQECQYTFIIERVFFIVKHLYAQIIMIQKIT